jgi:magnesium-transporting ATPase (P-type)
MAQLAGCHSLIHLNSSSVAETASQVVGDPLDQAAFLYSGWKYNDTNHCYEDPSMNISGDPTTPIRLWQVKSFPFDPNKRVSSALVVIEEASGTLRLLAVIKGSSETMRSMYQQRTDGNFTSAFDKQVKNFEVQGHRSIAMGWKDLTDSVHMEQLFPSGLNAFGISNAQKLGSTLHRSDIEGDDMQFGGFVTFHASIRPSSRRVIDELNAAGIRSIMLTGDAIDAAITVASTVKLIQQRKVAILEMVRDESGLEQLQWNFVEISNNKGGASRRSTGTKAFTRSSLHSVLKREMEGKCAIACSGSVLDEVLNSESKECKDFMDNLFRVSVIARATPKQKKIVISSLKSECGRSVMMCGMLKMQYI